MITLKEVFILGHSDEITIKGKVFQGNLQYDTQMLINTTQLNLLLNALQKQNPDVLVCECFEEHVYANMSSAYFLKLSEMQEVQISATTLGEEQKLMQIRA